ncbi:hypothetical protein CERSUDRAFT_98087 [Gelatoporia subvermispora B]|uniref:Uncharacterized protein n=1 Tax=Ceriporiopsis subvermispora (strain B) TaxID=914234 RepID=M2PE67_CERS8|nr:hypothetical protein CERSUDRAFT_98087 [Gelatoporia subvermispora B]
MPVNPSQSRGPYNLPPGGRDVDSVTYNPMADARPDAAEFDPDHADDLQPVGARGAANQATGRNFGQEDTETAQSDKTGQIPRGEVDDLLSSTTKEERNVAGKTRGNRVDAYKQEREVDRFMQDNGLEDADQDIEIGRATGP